MSNPTKSMHLQGRADPRDVAIIAKYMASQKQVPNKSSIISLAITTTAMMILNKGFFTKIDSIEEASAELVNLGIQLGRRNRHYLAQAIQQEESETFNLSNDLADVDFGGMERSLKDDSSSQASLDK